MSFLHGGNVYEIAAMLGCGPEEILDFSASINPLGPPPGLMEELERHFHLLQHYPDIRNEAIVHAIAEYERVPAGMVVVGNGSTELIYWLPGVLKVKSAAIVLPTFSEYRKAFELQGVRLEKLFCSRENGFQPTVEQLERVCDALAPDAVLLTNPASPAGTTLPPPVREWVLEKGCLGKPICIVDEAFVDFCPEESFKPSLAHVPNLVLIRSMTKFYGIPGLRLGYLLASEDLAARCRASLPPWGVSTFAQVGGVYCLRQETYRRETLALVEEERSRLQKAFSETSGVEVFPGRANYLLLHFDGGMTSAGALQEALLQSRRILIRDCSTFQGLDGRFVRVAVRLPQENQRLVEGIREWASRRA